MNFRIPDFTPQTSVENGDLIPFWKTVQSKTSYIPWEQFMSSVLGVMLSQSTGSATNMAMSQKATTDAINAVSGSLSSLLPLDGSRPMAANLNMAGNNIDNVYSIAGGAYAEFVADSTWIGSPLYARGFSISDTDITIENDGLTTIYGNGTTSGIKLGSDIKAISTGGFSVASVINGFYANIKTDNITSNQTFQFPANGGTFEVSYYKGIANGYAGLDASGKVPTSQLPAGIVGAMQYQGTWDPSTNTPALASGVGTTGYFYKVSVTSNATVIDGNGNWHAGDWIVFNGTTWDKIDNYEAVTTVFGRVGDIALLSSDVTGALGYTPGNDSLVVHLAGAETISGQKTFSADIVFSGTTRTISSVTGNINTTTFSSGATITLSTVGGSATSGGVIIASDTSNISNISGTRSQLTINGTFAPTSGAGIFNSVLSNVVINQTGATGLISLFNATPTLVTSVTGSLAGFTSDISDAPAGGGQAYNFYGIGTAPNYFNGNIIAKKSIISDSKQTYTSGSSVIIASQVRALYVNPSSAIASLTITMLASPVDGEEILISFGGTITSGTVVTSLTISGNSGQSILGGSFITSASAGDGYTLKWEASTNLWRIF
jgi:hypothetical protein